MTREEALRWHSNGAFCCSVEGMTSMSNGYRDTINKVFDYIEDLELQRCKDKLAIAKLNNKIKMGELDRCMSLEEMHEWEIKYGIITNETN